MPEILKPTPWTAALLALVVLIAAGCAPDHADLHVRPHGPGDGTTLQGTTRESKPWKGAHMGSRSGGDAQRLQPAE